MQRITSRHVTQALKAHLFPALEELGFTWIGNRSSYRRHPEAFYCLNYYCVGSNMGKRANVPSVSIELLAGVLLPSAVNPFDPVAEFDSNGCPRTYTVTSSLYRELSSEPRAGFDVPPDGGGCWWVDSDGGNLVEVASGIAEAVRTEGEAWFARWSTEERAIATLLEPGTAHPRHTWLLYSLAKKQGRLDIQLELLETLKRQWPKYWEAWV